MSDRIERDARWVRLAVWTAVLVVLAVTAAVTINIVQRNRTAEHKQITGAATSTTPTAAPAPSKTGDYDTYERVNAERNREQIAREEAAYDAYRSARKATDEPSLRRLPEPKMP
ncbi:MAG: hypothetical protein Q7U20_00425 [Caulobacter sp.]|nr:hypothetical protein [Caulobacter sp.]